MPKLKPAQSDVNVALTRSRSARDVWYLVQLDDEGRGLACTCAGFSYRGKCRHLDKPGQAPFRAAWSCLMAAGVPLEDIKRLWKRAQSETSHPARAAVRFAFFAGKTINQQR